ncbi:MAG TPA: AAA family ATPase [Oscillatoriaceae cyanobacterium M33_DOE_052]|uniref:GAF domain-containing protein n=1 Tax=Planktothricoides sp. SpSt-374 TaxID=2282167 RepID=A0A7C3VJC8_9CYAN|nr:AAA family ATPase [Oscillatoriaceae cyanobacterium M33_DOE_052]
MINIPGVTAIAQIYESPNSLVYRGIREPDGIALILKVLKENYPTPQELARYRTEYQITKSLNVPGVIKVYDLQKYQNTLVMFVEDFGGESLKIWSQQGRFPLGEFLQIAIKATQILGEIHAANIIHKDITPANIIWNPSTEQVKIIDFGISTQLTRENTGLKNPLVLEGTLPYMSPEQTGRMNRPLDYRSDFYSLGVTFYELLTGKLPFETTDPLELLHCHIAKQPLPPAELNSQIPPVISEIVMKLLDKNAEDRYQSAVGIKADLEKCWQQLQANQIIASFPLASQDISDKFHISPKLYGREAEVETLLTAFDRVSSSASELMLIAGYSGIGKSALVQEIYKPITQKRGYFISGKFDQYQRNIPYSAVVIAFQELIKQLLTETEAELAQWRDKLLAAVGVNGQVIVDVIPEIELIIGQQVRLPELGPNEAQNRFNLVFQNFIKVFTQPEHPLVLFLDDLQWADGASLKLMQLLMSAASPGLFLIGAYRDNEVSPVHPLMQTMDEIAEAGARISRISLSPLDLGTVTQLISDTVKSPAAKVASLGELVLWKTGGNPFFINEFLKSLYTENLLSFDYSEVQWHWDLEQIKARGFTDNVVELMAGKIQKLPELTQNLLKLAACIGNLFDLKTLGLISEKSLPETVRGLQAAVAENLVAPVSNPGDVELAIASAEFLAPPAAKGSSQSLEYKFAHDRIQQAAYSLIPDHETASTHYQIGQLLLQQISPAAREENIFKLANQLNYGISLITTPRERYQLAEMNLIACRKARAAAAYQAAREYARVGLSLLEDQAWSQEYRMTLALHELAAELALLSGDFEEMEKFSAIVTERAQSLLDQVNVYRVQIQANVSRTKFAEAIAIAQLPLQKIGVTLPTAPTPTDIEQAFQEIKDLIGDRTIEDLVNLPVMTDAEQIFIVHTLSSVIPAAYVSGSPLFPLLVALSVKLSIQHGNTSYSGFSYATYGIILCNLLDITTGTQFGQLAFNMVSKFEDKSIKPEVLTVLGAFILHRKFHIKETLSLLQDGYATALEVGNLVFAGYNASNFCINSLWGGQPLANLEQDTRAYYHNLVALNQMAAANYCLVHWQCILSLREVAASASLSGHTYLSEAELLPKILAANDMLTLYFFYLYKLKLAFLFEELNAASQYAVECRKYLVNGAGFICESAFYLYDSLVALSQLSHQVDDSSLLWERVAENQTKLQQYWANYAPMNYQHKVDLVSAEQCRVLGQKLEAMDLYDRAIKGAQANSYMNEAALAYELAAKFYLAEGKDLIARAYLQEARYHYQLWGANAKVNHLEQRYPQLLTAIQATTPEIAPTIAVTTREAGASLDIATVMKAASTMSGEIVLARLLSNLMKILIENAGAQKGYLILTSQGQLLIEASGTLDSNQITVLPSMPLADYQGISQAIVNYVARTQASVVLNDATKEGKFTNDVYIQKNRPKSILCVPLVNQGQLVSIVYLENNLTTGAFTPERLQVLQLLSGQAAISIKNAKLYTEVRANEQRLAQLNQAYERFVPSQFLQFLGKSSIVEVKQGDQVQLEMSVLFSDIRSFTTLSESMTPEDNFKFINAYLRRMEPAIVENNGFIDKYIGDAMMALFSGEADNAVKAGISMLYRLAEYNQHRLNSGYAPIQNGIGINTGSLMLGTVGGQNRMDGTVISDAVNLASRLETITKNYGVSLLISENTFLRLKEPDHYAIRMIDRVTVKGKSQQIAVYEVFDADPPHIKAGKLATRQPFTEGWHFYNRGFCYEAAQRFEICLRHNPDDRVAQIYLQRCWQKK